MAHIIILAAGKGTRMKSEVQKVLHEVKGTSIINHMLARIESICTEPTLIVGFKADEVKTATGNKYHYVEQTEQLGTGHAIKCAREDLKDRDLGTVIILPGDHPLVEAKTLQYLLELHADKQATVTLATTIVPHFDGEYSTFAHYGRVIRGEDGTVDRIVEYKDATEEERACREVNLFYYCFDAAWLWDNITKLSNNNAAGEYYLTDMIHMAKEQGRTVAAYPIQGLVECLGINTPEQLKMVEEAIS